jgi:hypothetical protein
MMCVCNGVKGSVQPLSFVCSAQVFMSLFHAQLFMPGMVLHSASVLAGFRMRLQVMLCWVSNSWARYVFHPFPL